MWNTLIPYLLLVVLYIVVIQIHAPGPYEESLRSALFKCLPMLYLIVLVASCKAVSDDHLHLKNLVMAGLVASVCGDFFLNWMKKMFLPGVLCFGGGHMLYIMAFGFNPYAWGVGSVFAFFALMLSIYITSGIKTREDAVFDLKPLVSAYIFIIHTMGWRSYVYYQNHPNQKGSLFAFIGALTFMLSDLLLSLNMWKFRFNRAFLCIMVTYYLAQLFIGMSVIVPSKSVYRPPIQFFGV